MQELFEKWIKRRKTGSLSASQGLYYRRWGSFYKIKTGTQFLSSGFFWKFLSDGFLEVYKPLWNLTEDSKSQKRCTTLKPNQIWPPSAGTEDKIFIFMKLEIRSHVFWIFQNFNYANLGGVQLTRTMYYVLICRNISLWPLNTISLIDSKPD